MVRYDFGKDSITEDYSIINRPVAERLPFFVTGFGHYDCCEEYFTERDECPNCLLFYTLEGQGLLRYEGKECLLSGNQVVVINCRNYQYYSAAPGRRWRFLWIHFDGKCAQDMVDILNEGGLAVLDLSNRPDFCRFYSGLKLLEQSTDKNRELAFSDFVNELMSELIRHRHRMESEQKYAEYLPKIEYTIAYISEHYDRKINVDELAALCNLSKYYFIRIFQCVTGDTPYTFLTLVRMKQAKRLLLESNDSVGEIAAAVGFTDGKNFIAAFKKHVGTTPLKFRKLPRA